MSTNLEHGGEPVGNDPGRPGLGVGEGEVVVPRPRRRVSSQLLIVLLVVGVSATALYAMRRYGMKSGVKFDQTEFKDVDVDTEKARTYERIMADLASVQKPLDVALGDIGKSPFMHEADGPTIKPDVPTEKPVTSEVERHKVEAYTALKAMHLNSIIGNIARIDDQNLKVGDKFMDVFTVTSIEGRTVTFEAYGDPYTLTMEVKKAGASSKGSPKMHSNSNH